MHVKLFQNIRYTLTIFTEEKKMKQSLIRGLVGYLVASMFLIGITPKVEAGYIPSNFVKTNLVKTQEINKAQDIQKIQTILERKEIQNRLRQLGLSYQKINQTLSSLSAQDVHKIALKLGSLKIGKDGGLGVIVVLLVIIILVIYIIELTGHKVIVQ